MRVGFHKDMHHITGRGPWNFSLADKLGGENKGGYKCDPAPYVEKKL